MWAIKQENFDKRPTAEQKKVFREAWGNEFALKPTRIETHLEIRRLTVKPKPPEPDTVGDEKRAELKAKLRAWQAARKQARMLRKEARTNAAATRGL